MLLPEMDINKWEKIYATLTKSGYYCLNAQDAVAAYDYLGSGLAVRFAPNGIVIPNMEILFAADKVQKLALATRIPAFVRKEKIFVSDLELQIAYKERVLKSPKDMEDARHLRMLLGKGINKLKLNKYERVLK